MIVQYKTDYLLPIAQNKLQAVRKEYGNRLDELLKRERRLKGYKKFFFSRPSKEDESIEDFIHRNLGEITQIDRNCGRRVEFLEDLIKSCSKSESILLDEDERHAIFGYE